MITGGNVNMVNNPTIYEWIRRRGLGRQPNGENGADFPRRLSQVRRNLNGTVDHEASRRFLVQQWSAIAQTDRSKWNFDFETETPLPGNYDWKPTVTTAVTTPAAPSSSSSGENDASAAAAFAREIVARVDGDFLVRAAASAELSADVAVSQAPPVAGLACPAESPDTEAAGSSSQASSTLAETRTPVQPRISDVFQPRKRKASADNTDEKVKSNQQMTRPSKRSKSMP